MKGEMMVVTYRGAYTDARIALCARCAEDPPWPLGPVEYGLHFGTCAGCARETYDGPCGARAREWLDANDGAAVEDPGYFD